MSIVFITSEKEIYMCVQVYVRIRMFFFIITIIHTYIRDRLSQKKKHELYCYIISIRLYEKTKLQATNIFIQKNGGNAMVLRKMEAKMDNCTLNQKEAKISRHMLRKEGLVNHLTPFPLFPLERQYSMANLITYSYLYNELHIRMLYL